MKTGGIQKLPVFLHHLSCLPVGVDLDSSATAQGSDDIHRSKFALHLCLMQPVSQVIIPLQSYEIYKHPCLKGLFILHAAMVCIYNIFEGVDSLFDIPSGFIRQICIFCRLISCRHQSKCAEL